MMNKKIISIFIILSMLILFVNIGVFYHPVKALPTPVDNFNGEYLVYCIGTSITCGHNSHDPDPTEYGGGDVRSHQYPYQLDSYMNSEYGLTINVSDYFTNGSGWDKYNLGWGGCSGSNPKAPFDEMDETISGTNADWNTNREGWRLPNDPSDIDILIVEGGHHDINCQYDTPQELNSDIYDFYNVTHGLGITIILCALTPDYRATMHTAANITNPFRESLAENHSDCYYADVFSPMVTWSGGDWVQNSSMFSDGVHPNQIGYTTMAEAIGDVLYQVYLDMGSDNIQIRNINNQDNNTILFVQNRYFKWDRNVNATKYQLQVANSSSFVNPFINLSNISEGCELESMSGGDYYELGDYCYFYLPFAYNITWSNFHYYRVRTYTQTYGY